ncbi:ABC transporter ATP-binding protein [Rhizobium halophytocola]|uniref:Multiple sugar transport system ATP-binding protein n=1 Tax=Rhizobium halophytocola TaxID=735519 RepID=A0ABS4DTZ9_9HYPH|nr:ABC transporter ATP-binding protein [Rhizobium halophytocola]MBP1849160.1 multiple sugar transport system ATP-binding protein [Rhizobium halophytocola]
MAEIEIKGVAKQFGAFKALHSIDLTIADQEFMVLLGASGCGKTTLLRIIAGLETPSEGEIRIGGRRVDHLPPRSRGIAMVFQNYAIFPHLTVFENIAFGLRMQKQPEDEIRRRVTRTAEMMHIDPLLKRYSGQLSGGQRQRVAVARALAMEPDVILMDEPLSNLDALLRLEMRTELKGILAQSKTTTIYVTHDQVEAMSLADRISVMHKGRIIQAAPPTEVYAHPAARFVGSFIGNPPMNFLQATWVSPGKWMVAGMVFDGPGGEAVKSVEFAIRPEDVRPVAEGGIACDVRVVEPLGPHLLVTCDVQGQLFRAVIDNDVSVQAGETILLTPLVDRIRWFDPETQAAITIRGS